VLYQAEPRPDTAEYYSREGILSINFSTAKMGADRRVTVPDGFKETSENMSGRAI
jgi:hypothetical protein